MGEGTATSQREQRLADQIRAVSNTCIASTTGYRHDAQVTRRTTLAQWMGWTLGLGISPLGLGWLVIYLNDAAHLPTLQAAFGNGRPALSAIGLLAPALRQSVTGQLHWMAVWVIIGMLGATTVYAVVATKFSESLSQHDQHTYSIISLAVLAVGGAIGFLGMLVTYLESDR